MAAYDPSSLIKTGTRIDWSALIGAIKDKLPMMFGSVSADGPTNSTSGTFATLDSTTVELEADEVLFVFYRATLACNSVRETRSFGEIRITVDGAQVGKASNVYTDYENNSKDGAQAVCFGITSALSGVLTIAGQGRVGWDAGSGDTVRFGNRELIWFKAKYRTA